MSDIPSAGELLSTVQPGQQGSPFRLGAVAELFPNETAKIKFDGEETASEKQYAYLASYTPALNDRVLLAMTAGTYIILGKIFYTESPTDPPPEPTNYFTLVDNILKANYNMEIQGWLDALNTVSSGNSRIVDLKIDGKLQHTGSTAGFFGVTPVAQRYCYTLDTGAALTTAIAKINEMINDLRAYGLYRQS
jgi:hypothetical protein